MGKSIVRTSEEECDMSEEFIHYVATGDRLSKNFACLDYEV